jgi:hypothetical protein
MQLSLRILTSFSFATDRKFNNVTKLIGMITQLCWRHKEVHWIHSLRISIQLFRLPISGASFCLPLVFTAILVTFLADSSGPQRLEVYKTAGVVVILVESVSLRQGFLRVHRVSPVNITAPMYYTVWFIYSFTYLFMIYLFIHLFIHLSRMLYN